MFTELIFKPYFLPASQFLLRSFHDKCSALKKASLRISVRSGLDSQVFSPEYFSYMMWFHRNFVQVCKLGGWPKTFLCCCCKIQLFSHESPQIMWISLSLLRAWCSSFEIWGQKSSEKWNQDEFIPNIQMFFGIIKQQLGLTILD